MVIMWKSRSGLPTEKWPNITSTQELNAFSRLLNGIVHIANHFKPFWAQYFMSGQVNLNFLKKYMLATLSMKFCSNRLSPKQPTVNNSAKFVLR
jgi:hypothetical protein